MKVVIDLTPKQVARLVQHAVGHRLSDDGDATERALWRKLYEAGHDAEKQLAADRKAEATCLACKRERRQHSNALPDEVHTCVIGRRAKRPTQSNSTGEGA